MHTNLQSAHLKTQPVALTIAGFDPSGGAGVTADIQVFAAHGMFGVAAITAQTVQSTQGVSAVLPQDTTVLAATLQRLAEDFTIAGIKVGMLATADVVSVVAEWLRTVRESRAAGAIPVVLDPVLVSSSGHRLLTKDALEVFSERLLPWVDWLTPNWSELATITGLWVDSAATAQNAMEHLARLAPELNIVATGGDQARAIDFLRAADGTKAAFDRAKIESTATHGTGCAFSSALLTQIVLGVPSRQAVEAAKAYVEGAIVHAPGLGKGRGPLNFFWRGLQQDRENAARPEGVDG